MQRGAKVVGDLWHAGVEHPRLLIGRNGLGRIAQRQVDVAQDEMNLGVVRGQARGGREVLDSCVPGAGVQVGHAEAAVGRGVVLGAAQDALIGLDGTRRVAGGGEFRSARELLFDVLHALAAIIQLLDCPSARGVRHDI